MMMMLRLLSELSLLAAAAAGGLRAGPIVGTFAVLDGSDWIPGGTGGDEAEE